MAGPDGPVRPGPVHGREGVQPRQRRGRGVLRSHEDPGPCISGHWEERTCEEAGGLAGEYIRWYNQFEDQTVAGLEKPGRIQNKPGAGRIGKQLQENVRSPLSSGSPRNRHHIADSD